MTKVAAVFGADDVLLNGPKFQNGRAEKYSQSGDMRQRVLVLNITASCAYWRDHDESSS